MTDVERDAVYTALCRQMSELGEAQAPLYLARLALVAFETLDDADVALALIGESARDLQPGA